MAQKFFIHYKKKYIFLNHYEQLFTIMITRRLVYAIQVQLLWLRFCCMKRKLIFYLLDQKYIAIKINLPYQHILLYFYTRNIKFFLFYSIVTTASYRVTTTTNLRNQFIFDYFILKGLFLNEFPLLEIFLQQRKIQIITIHFGHKVNIFKCVKFK